MNKMLSAVVGVFIVGMLLLMAVPMAWIIAQSCVAR